MQYRRYQPDSRVTEWLRLEGILGDHIIQPTAQACSARARYQDHVQLRFEYQQEWRLHNLSGQLVPVFDHPYNKQSFSSCLNEISSVSVCAHLVTRQSGSIFFILYHQIFNHIDKVLPETSSLQD